MAEDLVVRRGAECVLDRLADRDPAPPKRRPATVRAPATARQSAMVHQSATVPRRAAGSPLPAKGDRELKAVPVRRAAFRSLAQLAKGECRDRRDKGVFPDLATELLPDKERFPAEDK